MILSKFRQQSGLGVAIGLGSLLPASTALAQTEAVAIKRLAQPPDQ